MRSVLFFFGCCSLQVVISARQKQPQLVKGQGCIQITVQFVMQVRGRLQAGEASSRASTSKITNPGTDLSEDDSSDDDAHA